MTSPNRRSWSTLAHVVSSSPRFQGPRWKTQNWWPLEDVSPASKKWRGLGISTVFVKFRDQLPCQWKKPTIWRCSSYISYQKWITMVNFHLYRIWKKNRVTFHQTPKKKRQTSAFSTNLPLSAFKPWTAHLKDFKQLQADRRSLAAPRWEHLHEVNHWVGQLEIPWFNFLRFA